MERSGSGSGSGSKSAYSDWSHLPPDIVQLISEKFKSITDYLRFRAVCSPWRSASLPRPRHLPPQLPWLMLTHKPYKKQKGQRHNGVYLFYDLERSKLREVHLPETTGMVCCASYQGWLLLLASKGREVLLLNPITRARIQLPPFTAPVKRFGDGRGGLRYNTLYLTESESHMDNFANSKVTFSADLTDPNCLIMVFLRRCGRIFCCRVGDPCWTKVDFSRVCPYTDESVITGLLDVTYYNGQFYLLYKKGLNTIDQSNNIFIWVSRQFDFMCSLEGKSGVYVADVYPKEKFELYEVDEQSKKMKTITNTRGMTIFYGDNYPCLAVYSDDWDLLHGKSVNMDYKYKSYVRKRVVRSHHGTYPAKQTWRNVQLVRDLGTDPRVQQAKPAMLFQPSFV